MKAKSELFQKFSKGGNQRSKSKATNLAVVYTRVSRKKQVERASLKTQEKSCFDYCSGHNLIVAKHFGGTYESAQTDERKEFKKMLAYVRRNPKISHIVVYMIDRFSRSGIDAAFIAKELDEKQGVKLHSVMQPADTSTASGRLHRNIQFVFSQYDNDIRREKTTGGTITKLREGQWCGKAPWGYDWVTTNSQKQLVINEEKAKWVRKAFKWKTEGGLNVSQIQKRLHTNGIKLNYARVKYILSNPLYCGLLTHRLLNGDMIEGNHQAIISRKVFLKANKPNNYTFKPQTTQDFLPLKRFMVCAKCGDTMRGFQVKKVKKWYYRCTAPGCSNNNTADHLHQVFLGELQKITIDPKFIAPLKFQLEAIFAEMNQERV